jgi:hypothetical protein
LLLLLPNTSGAVVKVALNVVAIQNALDAASPGDTVVLDAGELVLDSTPLAIPIPGVSLHGAGPGLTKFLSNNDNLPCMLLVTDTGATVTSAPTTIEGITFRNTAVPENQPLNSPTAVGPQSAIQVLVSGPTGSESRIRNCKFLNFITPPTSSLPSAVYFGLVSRWRIDGNQFDGLTGSLFIDGGSSMAVTGNTFTR